MTECWRAELRTHNVRVFLVNPSEVLTDFFATAGQARSADNPTKLRPRNIAQIIKAILEMDDRAFNAGAVGVRDESEGVKGKGEKGKGTRDKGQGTREKDYCRAARELTRSAQACHFAFKRRHHGRVSVCQVPVLGRIVAEVEQLQTPFLPVVVREVPMRIAVERFLPLQRLAAQGRRQTAPPKRQQRASATRRRKRGSRDQRSW